MLIYPAIDLSGGRCVRLYQGDFDAETVYDDDPAGVAERFQEEGARWLHVVDLDAARSGELVNIEVVSAIARRVEIPVQYGGGVRSADAARRLLGVGVTRLVVGTAALEHPELLQEIQTLGKAALGLDVRGREVAVRGWRSGSGRSISEVLADLDAAEGGARPDVLIVTQIGRDGTLMGPDCELLAEVLNLTDIPLVASGGVGNINHVSELAALRAGGRRLEGAIVGKALYEGTLEMRDLLAAAGAQDAGTQGADAEGADARGADAQGAEGREADAQDAGAEGSNAQDTGTQGAGESR